jgi:hypothetical protein
MTSCPTHQKFPEGSTNREYDVFEEFPDGTTKWRACVFGMGNVERKLRELASETTNKFFALNLQDRAQHVIRPFRLPARHNLGRAS